MDMTELNLDEMGMINAGWNRRKCIFPGAVCGTAGAETGIRAAGSEWRRGRRHGEAAAGTMDESRFQSRQIPDDAEKYRKRDAHSALAMGASVA